jgi:hypothetical protein
VPRPIPWWLEPSRDPCPACGVAYAVSVEVRCTGCDRGLCAECVVRVGRTRLPFCPECAEAA